MNISKEDIELAELIGLLHDIGRFEQVKRYHTFIDKKSEDHGKLGVKILFEDGLIRDFIEEDKYDEIIKKAILNHNKGEIEDGLDEQTKTHCKIIRDSDKLDILYVLTYEDKELVWESSDLSNDIISDEIYEEYMKEKKIDYNKKKCASDSLVGDFAYVYDLNYNYSLNELQKSNNLEKLYKRFTFKDKTTMERYNNVYKASKEYIEKTIKEDK